MIYKLPSSWGLIFVS